MKLNKKGKISLLVGIILATIVMFMIVSIFGDLIFKGNDAIANPIKKLLDMDAKDDAAKQQEAERVKKELQANAESVYAQFEAAITKCMSSTNGLCNCGTIDFTRLNDYTIKLTNQGGLQVLELLDSNLVPLPGKRKNLGNSLFLSQRNAPILAGFAPSDELIKDYKPYSERLKYIIFTKDSIKFNIAGSDMGESEGKMSEILFTKLTNEVYVADNEYGYGIKACST